MAGERELLAVDDKDVFTSALSDEPPAEQSEQQPSEEPKPEGERPRDEQGRFVPKEQVAETPTPAPLEPLKEQEPQRQSPEDAIPSWRLREVSQRARDAEERLATREAQLQQLLQQVQRQQPPEQPPDIIENPQGYQQFVLQQAMQVIEAREAQWEQREIRRSLERADETYGEEFKKAYTAFNSPALKGDERLYEHIRNSWDQGEAILEWYRQNDPQAMRERVKKELLADPEFRKEYGEALRSQATSRQPSNVTPLPNLTRAPGSSAGMTEIEPMNDRELFDYARRR